MPVLLRLVLGSALLVCIVAVLPEQSQAASLLNASASATTSRPSPSSPLSVDYSSGVSDVTVVDNSSTFLASDSAVFFRNGTQEYVTIATTSADKLTTFFISAITASHNVTGVLAVPISAMHTFVFTTQTAIPVGGVIEIAYPAAVGSDTVQASPSAATWMFNNQTTATIKQKLSQSAAGCTWTKSGEVNGTGVQTPKVMCEVTTETIPSGTTVWLWVGCSASSSTSCTTQVPQIINPTHNPTTGRGVADVKNIAVTTYNTSGGTILDQATLKMGTIESVFVVAHIDPTFSFNIDGVAAGTDMDSSSTFCGTSYADSVITNSNFPSTGTEVNLGTIGSGGETYAAQKLTIASNTGSGYVITATSSGFLLNPPTGAYVVNAQGNVDGNNDPAPTTISSTTGGYGINACDSNSRVNTTIWGQATPNFANPSPSYFYTLVNYGGAPSPTGGDIIYAVYGARAGSATPPGDYWQIITYTASVTF